jgi:hypothetical protein
VPDVDAIARRVADAHATKWGVELQPIELNPAEGAPARVSELDEVPPGARVHSHRCAIGYLDVACVDGRFRFGGDVLAARHTLRHFADDLARDPSAAPTLFADDALDGARPEDFLAAARDAMGAEPDAPG